MGSGTFSLDFKKGAVKPLPLQREGFVFIGRISEDSYS